MNTMQKRVFLFAGGELNDPSFFISKMAELKPSQIVCADGGAAHLYSAGMIPNVIIGDMDSLGSDIRRYFEDQGSTLIVYPETKDKTDTQLALDYIIDTAPDEIYIFGALGKRIDHALANVSLLVAGLEKGIPVTLMDEWCEMFIVTGERVIKGEVSQTVSLLPFSDRVTGITLQGFEYPLENGVMEIGKPYGISNRLSSRRGVIAVYSGRLLVIRYLEAGIFP